MNNNTITEHSALAKCLLLLLFPTLVMSVGKTRSSHGVPVGWKMTDRFIGFRYELLPTHWNDLKAAIKGETTL